jgi:hypothetical protein
MNDVKQHLREWEQSHRRVFVKFSEHRQFDCWFGGEIRCGTNCGNFDVVTNSGSRFSSPPLSAFSVVFLGPDPNHDNHTTIRLRHRSRRWEMVLADTGTEQLTPEEIQAVAEAFIASQKPTKGKSNVQ